MLTFSPFLLALALSVAFLLGFLCCLLVVRRRRQPSAATAEPGRVEAALRESQAFLRAVVDAVPATVNVRDRDGRYVLFNAFQAKSYDRPSEWFIGRSPRDIYPESYVAELAEWDRQMIETGKALDFHEIDFTTPDGRSKRWLMSRAPIHDATGVVSHIVSVGLDITDRYRVEAALRESQSLLHALVDAVPATVNVRDRDGRYVFVNALHASYHDRPVDWFPGHTASDLYDAGYVERMHAIDRRVIESGKPEGLVEFDYTERDGRISTWLLSCAPIRNTAGEVAYVVRVALDISARKQAEAALAESRTLLRAVVDSVPATIAVRDLDCRYVLVNEALARYHGRPIDWFPGRPPDGLYPDEYIQQIRAADRGIVESRARRDFYETDFRERDGRLITWLASRAPIFDASGAVKYVVAVGLDISERKRAEEALRESEALLVLAQDMAKLGHWITTWRTEPGGATVPVTRYSSGAAKILGVPPAKLEISDQAFIERFVHPDDRKAALANYRSYMNELAELPRTHRLPRDLGGGYRIVRPDGEIRFLTEVVVCHLAEDGAPRFIMGTIQDITERRQAEAQRHASEALKAVVLECALDAVIVIDEEGRILEFNPAAEQTFGRARGDVLGRSMADLIIPPRLREQHRAGLARLKAGGGGKLLGRRLELPTLRTDGAEFPVELAIEAAESDGRRVFVGFLRDITERKRAEAALRESEGRFRSIADSIPALVWMSDEKGDCIFLNKQWSAFTGRPLQEELGRGFATGIHPDDRQHSADIERDIFARRAYASDEYRLRGKDGQYRWFLDTMAPRFGADGAYLGHLGILIDIEDRRRLEEQLRQIQKLEAVGQMTGGIAHDFNNLLTVVIGNLDLIRDYPDNPKNVAQLAGIGLQAAQRGAELVHRMVAFSRQQMLKPRKIDLNRLVSGMSDMLRRSLSANIEIEMRLPDGLWTARADPGQVEDSLLNLAINARDAMPDGGRLIVETANVSLDAERAAQEPELVAGDYVMLAVSDTGVGMTPEVLMRAVQPFFTTKEVGKGSGLGLSMVYGFAKQSGGHMKIYSEAGHGCTVRLYLPRYVGALEVPAEAVRAPPAGGSETILVVEDDELVRTYVVGQLKTLGYSILEAKDGPTALALIAGGRRIDLLFSDVMLPGGLLGPQLLEQARGHVPGLRALLTSGYSEATVLPRQLDSSVRLLQKPYSRQDLAAHIRAALDARPEQGVHS